MLGVVPWLEHGLPDEDGAATPALTGGRPRVAVVRYPTASNLDEYRSLEQVVDLVWAYEPDDLAGAALVVLPGSKHVALDRGWLHHRGFDEALRRRAAGGEPVLAVCGGLQLAGERFDDLAGVDGSGVGLGLIPLRTSFSRDKRAGRVSSTFASLPEPWSGLTGLSVDAYEIRHGSSESTAPLREALPRGLGWIAGPVLAVYVHGLLENPAVVEALFRKSPMRGLDQTFDALADALDVHADMRSISALARVA
jgi:adenosylcobyric acid synthase